MARKPKQKLLTQIPEKFDTDFLERLSKRYWLTRIVKDRLAALEAHLVGELDSARLECAGRVTTRPEHGLPDILEEPAAAAHRLVSTSVAAVMSRLAATVRARAALVAAPRQEASECPPVTLTGHLRRMRALGLLAQAFELIGGAAGDRTPDLRIANATLSQLSYRPVQGRRV